jgi:hypothetical protein
MRGMIERRRWREVSLGGSSVYASEANRATTPPRALSGCLSRISVPADLHVVVGTVIRQDGETRQKPLSSTNRISPRGLIDVTLNAEDGMKRTKVTCKSSSSFGFAFSCFAAFAAASNSLLGMVEAVGGRLDDSALLRTGGSRFGCMDGWSYCEQRKS